MRFTANGHKVNRKVIYPSQLNVPECRREGQHKDVRSTATYSLCAVIVHEGTQISSGHYTCYTKRNGKWFYVSDTVVKEASLLVVHNLNAYMLFYEREVSQGENSTAQKTVQKDTQYGTCTPAVKINPSGISPSHVDTYAEKVKKVSPVGTFSEVKPVVENRKSVPVQSQNTNKGSMTNFSAPSVSRPTKPNRSKLSLRRVPSQTKKQMAPSPVQPKSNSFMRKSTTVELPAEDKSKNPLTSTHSEDKVTLTKSDTTQSTIVDSIAAQVKSKDKINIFPPSSTPTSPVNSGTSVETSLPTSPDSATSFDDDVIITKVETCRKSEYDTISHIIVKRKVPPDYYVQPGYQDIKPGLYKTKVGGNAQDHCPTVYTSLENKQKKDALDTAISGVTLNTTERITGWDPTDIVRLLPPSHKLSDALLSNFLVNKLFHMIEEDALKKGNPVRTCNMEVHQRMTEPSIEVFLQCHYERIYASILDGEVILCPCLDGDHWCLVAIFLKFKRTVYLDSLFRGIGAQRAFRRLGNFLDCAMRLRGEVYRQEQWEFFIIPTNDIAQQLNSVDCGVFVVKWAQHIAEGRVIDFNQQHIDDFRYSLILDIAADKLSCLATPITTSDSAKSDGQEIDTEACFIPTPLKLESPIFEEHNYARVCSNDILGDGPKKGALPQNVQKILPTTSVYTCLEYEELSDIDATEFVKFRVKFNIKDISSPKEIEKWVSALAVSSNIKYNTQGGYRRKGVKVLFAQWYICECKRKPLSRKQQQAKEEAKRRKQKRYGTHASNIVVSDKIHLLSNVRNKKTDCQSKMAIKIATTAVNGNTCEVELWWNHNHSVDSHHLTSFSAILPATKDKFLTYFKQGMSASESFHYHETLFMKDPVTVLLLADRKYCPSLRDVNNLYEKWRKTEKGPCNGSEMFDYLEDYTTKYNKENQHNGGNIFLQRYSDSEEEKPLIIAICTPMMSRVHKLQQAGEMAFMDSSGSLDRHNNPVYFMCTHHPSGALPLAVWVTSSQSEPTLKNCLNKVKAVLPKHAFGGNGPEVGPSIFLTDDDSAQRNALRAYWRSSVLLLCIFHFLQAVWRWLLDGANLINKNDRQHLMSLFQELVFADTADKFDTKENEAVSDQTVLRYPNFKDYLEHALERKEQWALCFRKGLKTRGNNTDNFTESMIFVFKCVILKRIRAYNLLELLKFITEDLEMYFQRKLLALAFGKPQNLHVTSRCFGRDASTVPIDNIKRDETKPFAFSVRSRNKNITYEVDTSLGKCTCPRGENGNACAHQAAVALQYGGRNLNFIPQSPRERYKLAVLAIGENPQLNVAKFVQLHEKPDCSANIVGDNEGIDENGHENIPQQNVEISNPESFFFDKECDETISLDKIIKRHHEVAADIELKLRNEDSNFQKCYFNFLKTYQKIVTKCRGHSPVASLSSAFAHFGKQQNNLLPVLHNGSRIRVQPTSISRRKSAIKSSSAQPPGPKPKPQAERKRKWNPDEKENMKIRKQAKKKRQHSLSINVKKNVANAGPKR